MNRGDESFQMCHHIKRTLVRVLAVAGAVAGNRIRHVTGQNRMDARLHHGHDADRLAGCAHVGVKTQVEQVRDAQLPAP